MSIYACKSVQFEFNINICFHNSYSNSNMLQIRMSGSICGKFCDLNVTSMENRFNLFFFKALNDLFIM